MPSSQPPPAADSLAAEVRQLRRQVAALQVENRRLSAPRRAANRTATLAAANARLRAEVRERRKAESALRASEARFQAFMDFSPAVAFIKDREGRYQYVNATHKIIFSGNIVGKRDHEWQSAVAARQLRRNDRAVLATGQPMEVVEQVRMPDGKMHSWLVSKFPMTANGGRRFLGGVGLDVTALRRTESALREAQTRLQLATHAARIGLWDWDIVKHEVYLSPECKHHLGFTDEELPNALPDWEARLHPEDRERKLVAIRAALRPPWPPFAGEFRLRHKDGSYRWILTHGEVLCDAEGRPYRMLGSHTDVTERKQAQAELLETQARLELAIHASRTGLWDWDVQTNAVYFSPEWKRQLGYADAELPSRFEEWESRLHPDDHARILGSVRASLAPPWQPYAVEFRLRHRDGAYRWILTHGEVLRDAQDRPVRMLGSHVDITELKQAQEALGEERNLLLTLSENLPAFIYVKDPQGRYQFTNQANLKLLGCQSLADVRGKTVFDFFPPEIAQHFDADDRAIFASGQPVLDREESYRAPDGSEGWFLTTKVPLRDARGQFTGLVGISQDITGRKRAEAALAGERNLLRTLVDSLPVSLFIKDTAGRYLLNNPMDLKWRNCPAQELVLGKTAADFFPPDIAARYQADDLHVLTTGQPVMNHEAPLPNAGGRDLQLLTSRVPLRDAQGRVTGLVGFSQDITELKRLQQELLNISEREQRRVGQDLHDGLCQVLGGIKFRAALLERELAEAAPQHAAEARTITGLLTEAVQKAGQLARGLHPVELDAHGLMAALQELAANVAEVFHVECRCDFPQPVPIHDNATATHLYRIAQEAISNALKHGRAKHITVTLTRTNERLTLAVKDDGKGLPRRPRKQTGMGLNIMRYRAGMIGGTLELRATQTRGIEVLCTLPVSAAAPVQP